MKRCAEIYRVDPEKYSQFPEENNCFLRALYDTQFPSFGLDLLTNMVKLVDSGEEGFSRVDLALYAASWTIDAHMPFASKWNPKPSTKDYIPVEIVNRSPDDIPTSQLTKYVKRAAKFFGACDVGITKIDQRWIMKNTAKISAKSSESSSENTPNIRKTPVVLPEGVTNAIVIAIEMDPTGIQCAPKFLEVASVGWGYSQMTAISATIAQFIRNLGYIAIPSTNDTGLSVPLAIDAGLGAQGRNGILLTRNLGPRVRLCKVFTNMPLDHDVPDEAFITKINAYCRFCRRCAEACEAEAISFADEPSGEAVCSSNNPGVRKKWYVNTNDCYGIWVKYGTDCGKCIQACPFSKSPESWTSEDFWNA
ncbi:MAG: 4Fe-4S dicluster domain-containing protein [Promethearchaeota archaeon]